MNTDFKKYCIWLAALFFISSACMSCSKASELDEGEVVTKDYIVVESNPTMGANTTSYELEVKSNCQWTLVCNDKWDKLEFSVNSGDGSTMVIVSTEKNDQPEDRSCHLTFKNADETFKREVTLTQTAGDFNVTLSVDPEKINVVSVGNDSLDFKVECNTSWSVSISYKDKGADEPDWCSVNKVNGYRTETVKLSFTANTKQKIREATVTISSGNRTGNKKESVINITQEAAKVPILEIKEVGVSDDLKTITGKVKFSSDYDVTDYGYCISTTDSLPTKENMIGTSGKKSGNFEFTYSDVEDGRTYYIRAYAKSDVGIGYSDTKKVPVKGDIPGNDDNNRPNLSRKNK